MMKKWMAGAMLAAVALTTLVDAADARPLGGGRSFGRQSQNVARQMPPAQSAQPMRSPAYNQPAAAPARATPPAAPRPSPWKGILGGLLVGAGLAALFSHFGMGAGMASALGSILMIGLLVMAVMFVIRMFRRNAAPSNTGFQRFEPAPAGAARTPDIGSGLAGGGAQTPEIGSGLNAQPSTGATWGLPADFDKDAFLRQAKSSFIRMQAAWDKGDVADLREFTTPEIFAELRMQIGERKEADFTDVVRIDAELLGIEDLGSDYMASVKFDAMIKSSPTAEPEPFKEVWNMTKPHSGASGWVLAGIQQLS